MIHFELASGTQTKTQLWASGQTRLANTSHLRKPWDFCWNQIELTIWFPLQLLTNWFWFTGVLGGIVCQQPWNRAFRAQLMIYDGLLWLEMADAFQHLSAPRTLVFPQIRSGATADPDGPTGRIRKVGWVWSLDASKRCHHPLFFITSWKDSAQSGQTLSMDAACQEPSRHRCQRPEFKRYAAIRLNLRSLRFTGQPINPSKLGKFKLGWCQEIHMSGVHWLVHVGYILWTSATKHGVQRILAPAQERGQKNGKTLPAWQNMRQFGQLYCILCPVQLVRHLAPTKSKNNHPALSAPVGASWQDFWHSHCLKLCRLCLTQTSAGLRSRITILEALEARDVCRGSDLVNPKLATTQAVLNPRTSPSTSCTSSFAIL